MEEWGTRTKSYQDVAKGMQGTEEKKKLAQVRPSGADVASPDRGVRLVHVG